MKNILLPVDGSESAMHAVDYAVDLLRRLPGEHRPMLHLLNVQRSLSPSLDVLVREEDITRHYADEAHKVLDPVAARLTADGISHAVHLVVGDEPAALIADGARQHDCELIVMGTRGLGKLQGLMMGSVATRVVHEASVPVLLVK